MARVTGQAFFLTFGSAGLLRLGLGWTLAHPAHLFYWVLRSYEPPISAE